MLIQKVDFRWRYQSCKETDIKLMQYIQHNQIKSKTEIILVAIRSFWLVHAVIDNSRLPSARQSRTQENVQSIARSCIQVLKRQAQEIGELAGLEESCWSFTSCGAVNGNSASHLVRNQSLQIPGKNSGNHVYDDAGLSNFL
jgi:hypothetical protein